MSTLHAPHLSAEMLNQKCAKVIALANIRLD
jgi:hypothetical protein